VYVYGEAPLSNLFSLPCSASSDAKVNVYGTKGEKIWGEAELFMRLYRRKCEHKSLAKQGTCSPRSSDVGEWMIATKEGRELPEKNSLRLDVEREEETNESSKRGLWCMDMGTNFSPFPFTLPFPPCD
jgi:hypothetical protein